MFSRKSLKMMIAASTALTPLPALAEDDFTLDDQPITPLAVEKPVLVNEMGAGIGYQAGHSGLFGRYSGATKEGFVGRGWIHLDSRSQDPDSPPYFLILDARNVDFSNGEILPDASARLRTGEQGKWELSLAYEGTPYLYSDNVHTVFNSSGSLVNGLTMNSINTTASNAAGVATAKQYMSVTSAGTRRDKVTAKGKYNPAPDWTISTSIEHEHKHGTKASSFMFINNNAFATFLEPVNYDTDRFVATAAYTQRRFQAQLSYVMSNFTDHQLQWVGQNPYVGTMRAGYGGSQYTLPPSNSEHQVKAQAGLNLGETGRLTINTRYGLQIQNDTFGGHFYDAGTARVTDSSYDGAIHNAYANLAYSLRPTKDWDLRAAYSLDKRDNRSDQYFISPSYRGDTGTATWNGTSGVRYTQPYSFMNQTVEVENGYRLGKSTRMAATYAYYDRQRDYSVTNRNQENVVGGKVTSTLSDDLTAHVSYRHGNRQAQNYNGNLAWTYLGRAISSETELGQFTYAARIQDDAKANLTYAIADQWSLSGHVGWTNNFYNHTTYGVTEDHTISVGPDLAWTPAPGIQTHLYYSYQEVFTRLLINTSSASTGIDWQLKNEDQVHTLGMGAQWQISDSIKLGLDNALSYGVTSFGISGRQRNTAAPSAANTPANLPDAKTVLNALSLSGEYKVNDALTLGLTGIWERLLSKDYLNWQESASTGNSTTTVLLEATGNPGYSVGILMLTASLKW